MGGRRGRGGAGAGSGAPVARCARRCVGASCASARTLAAPILLAAWAAFTGAAEADPPSRLIGPWPVPEAVADIELRPVRFPSHSPFTLRDVGEGRRRDPPTEAVARYAVPARASAETPVPAVVLLHGAGGVLAPRAPTYARQLAAMGVAALVVDAFAARRDMATGFVERLLHITEAMLIADAYEALAWLNARPEVDGSRVAIVGFSYGGMAAVLAAYAQVAEAYAPGGLRFAAHAGLYAPCLARFEDDRATGAPVIMLMGARDAITDEARCRAVARELKAGGAAVELVVYPEAYHQWDGVFSGPFRIGRDLSDCRLKVAESGLVTDARTWIPMLGPLTRKAILAACAAEEGYLIGRNEAVRARANRDLGAFLGRHIASSGAAASL